MSWAIAVKAIAGCAVTCLILFLVCGSAVAAIPLLDYRAPEMVSPLEKNGGEINGINGVVPNEGLPEGGIVQAATDGNSVTYLSLLAFSDFKGNEPAGAPIASQYLSTRSGDAWLIEDLTLAVNSKTYPAAGNGAPYKAFSTDLSRSLMLNGGPPPVENPPLASAPPEYVNYYLSDRHSGDFEALLTDRPAEEPGEFSLKLLGVNPDIDHIVVSTRAALPPVLTPQIRGNLYEWTNGQFYPINILPGVAGQTETASGGASLGMEHDESHTISNDGTRVFWSQGSTGSLFVREGIGTEHVATVQIDASRGGSDASGFGEFRTASVSGSKAFFTDRNRLTPDSTAGGDGSHEDLYMFNIETNQLSDLTVDGSDLGGAAVRGVVEASENGSYVYFVAEGGLPGTEAVTGNNNLYVWHDGVTKFIVPLSSNDSGHGGNYEPTVAHDWDRSAGLRSARIAAGGQRLVFMSDAPLTSYDNRDVHTGVRYEEVYLYDASTGRLICVSCNPSDARPVGPSGIPGGTAWRTGAEQGTYQSHVLSEDGSRVFFDSKDALVPQDRNGVQDVYEWEQEGSGTCRYLGGCLSLLSGGTNASDSSFVDASLNGSDAFFVTRAELVAQDTDQLRDLYDARVNGGFPPPPSPGPPCEGESCLRLVSPSQLIGPLASVTFSGVGNLSLAPSKPAGRTKAHKRSKTTRRKTLTKKARRKARARSGRRGKGQA